MSELPSAALPSTASAARPASRPGAAARDANAPRPAGRERSDAAAESSARESLKRRDSGSDRDSGHSAKHDATRGGEGDDTRARASGTRSGADADARETAPSPDDDAPPFATLLAAQLAPATTDAAPAAGMTAPQSSSTDKTASDATRGGKPLPPVLLEQSVARQRDALATALPGAAAEAAPVAADTLAGQGARAGAPAATAGSELAVADARRKLAETLTGRAADAPANDSRGAPALSTAAAGDTSVTNPGARLDAAVDVPLGNARWAQAFGERVTWMVREGAQLASLRLDPPQLGPMDVRVSVSNGEASLSFVSAHAPVRDAIEAALPRLRELLGEQGLALGNVDVSGREARGESDAPGDGERRAGQRTAFAGIGDEAELSSPLDGARILRGLLDHYA